MTYLKLVQTPSAVHADTLYSKYVLLFLNIHNFNRTPTNAKIDSDCTDCVILHTISADRTFININKSILLHLLSLTITFIGKNLL